jgi:hypothetical protein
VGASALCELADSRPDRRAVTVQTVWSGPGRHAFRLADGHCTTGERSVLADLEPLRAR